MPGGLVNNTTDAAHFHFQVHRGRETKWVYVTFMVPGVSKIEIISAPLYLYLAGKLNAVRPTGPIYQQGPGSIFPFQVCSFNNSWNAFAVLPWPCTTQYISESMAPLPCIQVCQSNEGAMSISNCSVAPVITHRECHCYISFEFYKHYSAWALSSKCVY